MATKNYTTEEFENLVYLYNSIGWTKLRSSGKSYLQGRLAADLRNEGNEFTNQELTRALDALEAKGLLVKNLGPLVL